MLRQQAFPCVLYSPCPGHRRNLREEVSLKRWFPKVPLKWVTFTWQFLGPLLKVKLLVGYIRKIPRSTQRSCSGISRSPKMCQVQIQFLKQCEITTLTHQFNSSMYTPCRAPVWKETYIYIFTNKALLAFIWVFWWFMFSMFSCLSCKICFLNNCKQCISHTCHACHCNSIHITSFRSMKPSLKPTEQCGKKKLAGIPWNTGSHTHITG